MNSHFSVKTHLRFWYFYILICILFSSSACVAQEKDSTPGNFGIEVALDYGFLIAHRPVLVPLEQAHVKGIELAILRPATGKKTWEEIYLHPDYGVNIILFDLGSPDHLGKGVVVYPFIDFPLNKSEAWQLHLRYGIGFGYVEKIFERDINYGNAAIGSHLNGVMHFDFHFSKQFSKQITFESGFGITHYSNGSMVTPNLGINIATAHAGLIRYFGPVKPIVHPLKSETNKKAYWQAYIGGAIKQIYPPLGKNYYAGTFSVLRVNPVSLKSAWGIGADLFYDNSLIVRMQHIEQADVSEKDNWRPGIYGAYRFSVGHIGLSFNIGYYPYTKYKDDGNIYHRISLQYSFNRLFVCTNLKTHYARADFVDLGVGYRFD